MHEVKLVVFYCALEEFCGDVFGKSIGANFIKIFKLRDSNNSQRRQIITLKNETKAKKDLRIEKILRKLKVLEASKNYLWATENQNISQVDVT